MCVYIYIYILSNNTNNRIINVKNINNTCVECMYDSEHEIKHASNVGWHGHPNLQSIALDTSTRFFGIKFLLIETKSAESFPNYV